MELCNIYVNVLVIILLCLRDVIHVSKPEEDATEDEHDFVEEKK